LQVRNTPLSPAPSSLGVKLLSSHARIPSALAARRAGGAVQSISAEADQTALLRFFGWMAATNRPLVGDSITFMIRDDLGDIAQECAQWLQVHASSSST
jgi:hypothetical protein